jgi:hypothetical protein
MMTESSSSQKKSVKGVLTSTQATASAEQPGQSTKHGQDGFLRKGKFKKASNMNYGLALSLKVEEKL